MAVLRIEDGELALHLSAAEKVGAVHGDLRIPLSAVRRVEVLENAHEPADHGMKLGTRIPGRSVPSRRRGLEKSARFGLTGSGARSITPPRLLPFLGRTHAPISRDRGSPERAG